MKLTLTILALVTSVQIFAQLGISTNYRQDGYWIADQEKWEITSTDDAGTLFEFNKELTLFKHTTESITSTYYIQKWDYNEEESKYNMEVTSDAGNKYEMIIDGVNNCVIFFYWLDDVYYMVRHTIKNSWYNE